MNYRCPNCSAQLSVRRLFFSDVSACAKCGERVALGDFFAFFMSAVSMLVTALSSVYLLTHELNDPYVAGGLAVAIGMAFSIVVLILLGRAQATKKRRRGPDGELKQP